MNNINKLKVILMLCIIFMMTISSSCKKSFLEIVPKGKQLAQTVNDYDLLLDDVSTITSSDCQVPSGDEVMGSTTFLTASNKWINCFLWKDVIYDQPDQTADEMTDILKMLYKYNTIINEVMTATNGTDQQRKAIQAEGRANRAWVYMMLINYYGKPYTTATAAADPGVPIITESDVTSSTFNRATVQQVYDFIVKDLTEAIPDLPAQPSSRIRIGKSAGEALLGKIYWFMARYPDALTQFNASFTDLANQNAFPVRLYDLAVQTASGGVYYLTPNVFGLSYVQGPAAMANEECLYARETGTLGIAIASTFVLAPWAKALYSTPDLRLRLFTPYQSGTVPNDAYGSIRRLGPGSVILGMSLPDMYLMRAECEARTSDFTGARADLLSLRRKRMPEAAATDATIIPSGTDPKVWVQFVLDERVREFSESGYRWFDMRRLSVDPMFSGITFTHSIYKSATDINDVETLTLKPERLTFRFPQSVINQNPGMVNNP